MFLNPVRSDKMVWDDARLERDCWVVCTGKFAWIFEICRELEFCCFGNVKQFVCETWNLQLVNLFFVWFSFMWMVICRVYCRCRAFMFATVALMTCLRVLYKPLWPVDHFMFAFHVHDRCLCCCECWCSSLLCGLPWNGDPWVFNFWPEVTPVSHGLELEKRV